MPDQDSRQSLAISVGERFTQRERDAHCALLDYVYLSRASIAQSVKDGVLGGRGILLDPVYSGRKKGENLDVWNMVFSGRIPSH